MTATLATSSTGLTNFSGTSVATSSFTIPANGLVVVYAGMQAVQTATPTISDTLGLTWTLKINQPNNGQGDLYVWLATSASGGSTTVTVNYGDASQSTVIAEVWSSASGIGATNSVSRTGNTKTWSVSLTTTAANSIVASATSGLGSNSDAIPSGWTLDTSVATTASLSTTHNGLTDAYIAVPTSGTLTSANWSAGGFRQIGAVCVVEILAATGSPTPVNATVALSPTASTTQAKPLGLTAQRNAMVALSPTSGTTAAETVSVTAQRNVTVLLSPTTDTSQAEPLTVTTGHSVTITLSPTIGASFAEPLGLTAQRNVTVLLASTQGTTAAEALGLVAQRNLTIALSPTTGTSAAQVIGVVAEGRRRDITVIAFRGPHGHQASSIGPHGHTASGKGPHGHRASSRGPHT